MANYYNPYQFNPYAVNVPQYQPQQQTIQQGGFVPVSNEKEAFEYPVAQGTSVTFIDGNNQKMYIKTRGFSPMEKPSFRKYNLVEVTDGNIQTKQEQPTNLTQYVEKVEFDALKDEFEAFKSEFSKPKKKEVKKDE